MRRVVIAMFLLVVSACATGRSDMRQDIRIADDGYRELLNGNYERAEANFKVALSINPQNPYALLNLGVLYQNTMRLDEARKMYQQLIDLNPDEVAVESTSGPYKGRKLVDIAKENLSTIGFPQQ